jgi:fatty acid desaturase
MARSWWPPLSWAALFNAYRFLAEHSQEPREAGLTETTRDITSAWLTLFVFPHHVGLHRTHHRFPKALWEALPRLRQTD